MATVTTHWQGKSLQQLKAYIRQLSGDKRMMCATCGLFLQIRHDVYRHSAGPGAVSCGKEPVPVPSERKTKRARKPAPLRKSSSNAIAKHFERKT